MSRVASRERAPTDREERFVISRRSSGLGDCIHSLMSAWYYAKRTGRTLVVDWRRSRYVDERGRNAFPALFEPVSAIDGVPVICDESVGTARFPAPVYTTVGARGPLEALGATWSTRLPLLWRLPFARSMLREAERDEARLVESGRDVASPTVLLQACLPVALPAAESRAFLSRLRPRPEIQAEIERYAASRFGGSPVIALHVRHGNGGDVMNHAKYWSDETRAIADIRGAVDRVRSTLGDESLVFLCTDSKRVEEEIASSISNVITRDKYLRPIDAGELHDRGARRGGRLESARDAVAEMFLLGKADGLVCYPPDSYFSLYARLCDDGPKIRAIDELRIGSS
ncbi:MAG: nodulation protein NodZ [Gemmatimonadetes bacterium]|nr:nodulation protein NodZ [Gemmatimonadota bacterium]